MFENVIVHSISGSFIFLDLKPGRLPLISAVKNVLTLRMINSAQDLILNSGLKLFNSGSKML